ncbi:hypothetical protein Hdeb2414_s0526g00910811 [Helianthus debilis subsp. tardiflorus]
MIIYNINKYMIPRLVSLIRLQHVALAERTRFLPKRTELTGDRRRRRRHAGDRRENRGSRRDNSC